MMRRAVTIAILSLLLVAVNLAGFFNTRPADASLKSSTPSALGPVTFQVGAAHPVNICDNANGANYAGVTFTGDCGTGTSAGIFGGGDSNLYIQSAFGANNVVFRNASTQLLSLSNVQMTSCTGFTSNASQVLACTASNKAAKIAHGLIPIKEASAGLDKLDGVIYSYKDPVNVGPRPGEFFGLYADDVCKIDERLCVRDPKTGAVKDFWRDGVIAMLIADRHQMERRLSDLEKKMRNSR